jgi:hypothetical protein
MQRYEQDRYQHESATGEIPTPQTRPPRLKRARRGEIAAENIRRIYAALLDRADRAGLPRHESETPFEFYPRLARAFPDAGTDLHAITDAYVAVHYAEHAATRAEVDSVRAAWTRAREILQIPKRTK